jgi:hypothetical protein
VHSDNGLKQAFGLLCGDDSKIWNAATTFAFRASGRIRAGTPSLTAGRQRKYGLSSAKAEAKV